MTSKEALFELKRINEKQNNGSGDIWLEMIIQPIEKDLEVLEIIKKWGIKVEQRDWEYTLYIGNHPFLITKELYNIFKEVIE